MSVYYRICVFCSYVLCSLKCATLCTQMLMCFNKLLLTLNDWWRHMRGFLKSRCDSHAPSLNKFWTSFGESFLRLYCSVRYVLQLKVTFHVCPYIPTRISRLKFAFAILPVQLSALKLTTKTTISKTNRPGPGSMREMGQYGRWSSVNWRTGGNLADKNGISPHGG